MFLSDLENLISVLSENEKEIAIVCAGRCGRELEVQLSQKGITPKMFLDNNERLWGTLIGDVVVSEIKNLGDDWLYVIAILDEEAREKLRNQLLQNSIREEAIIEFCFNKGEKHYRQAYLNGKAKEELSELYERVFSRKLNWENPTRYTEILNVEKLNQLDPIKTRLADKVEARKWISEKIGEQYLVKRYFEWDSVEEIDFEKLPMKFVLKLNNASGRNIIVKNKDELDIEQTRRILRKWFSSNYAFANGNYEMQYKDIIPKIVCDEYLEGLAETVYDYNIYCFHGKPEFIWCIKGSHRPGCQASFYDKDWKMQPFSFGYPKDPVVAPKPAQLEEMLRLSTVLCEGFRHVRVDWFNMPDGRVLFGEMTFTTWSGMNKFEPDEYDEYFGELILNNGDDFGLVD